MDYALYSEVLASIDIANYNICMKKYIILLIIIIIFEACGTNSNDSNVNSEDIITQPFSPTHWAVEDLLLYDEPDTTADVFQVLQRGTAVQGLNFGKAGEINGVTGHWIFIQTEDEKKGWCFGGYLVDKFSILLGFWADGEVGTGWNFMYFTDDKLLFGIFASDYYGAGNWNIRENDIYFDGVIVNAESVETRSYNFPLATINYDTVKVHETIYTRISEYDLSLRYTSKAIFDEILRKEVKE
jgi:hypothetical protein